MSITRPRAMTQEEAEELIKRMSQHGGQIIVQDPRMSGLINWFVGAVGIVALGVMAWGVNSLNELNASLREIRITNQYFSEQLANLRESDRETESRLRQVERK